MLQICLRIIMAILQVGFRCLLWGMSLCSPAALLLNGFIPGFYDRNFTPTGGLCKSRYSVLLGIRLSSMFRVGGTGLES